MPSSTTGVSCNPSVFFAEGKDITLLVAELSELPAFDGRIVVLCCNPTWHAMGVVASAVLVAHLNAATAQRDIEALRAHRCRPRLSACRHRRGRNPRRGDTFAASLASVHRLRFPPAPSDPASDQRSLTSRGRFARVKTEPNEEQVVLFARFQRAHSLALAEGRNRGDADGGSRCCRRRKSAAASTST